MTRPHTPTAVKHCVCGHSVMQHRDSKPMPCAIPGCECKDLVWCAVDATGANPVAETGALERVLADEILAELTRARTKFPGDNVTMLALMEEVGELAKATFEESRERVRQEAVQVATMAMRVVLDGDATLDVWRHQRGLDPLLMSTEPGPEPPANLTPPS